MRRSPLKKAMAAEKKAGLVRVEIALTAKSGIHLSSRGKEWRTMSRLFPYLLGHSRTRQTKLEEMEPL